MNLYAESSAVLAWLFGEKAGLGVRAGLLDAETVVASDLTLLECERAIWRAIALGQISEGAAEERRSLLATDVAHWTILRRHR